MLPPARGPEDSERPRAPWIRRNPTALGRVPAKGATCSTLPSAPCFPHRGGSWSRLTGTMARWAPTSRRCSRGEFRHCQPAEPRLVPAHLRVAPVRWHPSELGPLTCFKPGIPGSSSGRRRTGASPCPAPCRRGTVRLARGWREHRPLGHPRLPGPAAAAKALRPSGTGPDLPTAKARPLPTPLPPRRGGTGGPPVAPGPRSPPGRGGGVGGRREQYRWPHGYCPPRG